MSNNKSLVQSEIISPADVTSELLDQFKAYYLDFNLKDKVARVGVVIRPKMEIKKPK